MTRTTATAAARRSPRPARTAAPVLAALAVLALTPPADAQGAATRPCHPSDPHCPTAGPPSHAWQEQARILGINAAIGGFTAGIRSHARGGSFWRGFAGGAAGGGAVYAGKRLSAEYAWGAGVAGRQVAAIGASVVRNASEGYGALDRVLLPVGPVRLHLDRTGEPSLHARLDLVGTVVLLHHAVASTSRFDAGASLSAGTAVFHTAAPDRPDWHGSNTAGVIVLRDNGGGGTFRPQRSVAIPEELVFAHERIHLLQYDQALHTLGAPAEDWLLRRIPGGDRIARHIDLGLIVVPIVMLNSLIDYHDRPWEREAHFFAGH